MVQILKMIRYRTGNQCRYFRSGIDRARRGGQITTFAKQFWTRCYFVISLRAIMLYQQIKITGCIARLYKYKINSCSKPINHNKKSKSKVEFSNANRCNELINALMFGQYRTPVHQRTLVLKQYSYFACEREPTTG